MHAEYARKMEKQLFRVDKARLRAASATRTWPTGCRRRLVIGDSARKSDQKDTEMTRKCGLQLSLLSEEVQCRQHTYSLLQDNRPGTHVFFWSHFGDPDGVKGRDGCADRRRKREENTKEDETRQESKYNERFARPSTMVSCFLFFC